jgi:hypothetical protein
MHHRKNRSQGGQWTPSNIVRLCGDCHRYLTHHPLDEEGWTLDRSDTPSVMVVLRYDRWLMRKQWTLLDDEGGIEWVDGPVTCENMS